MRLSALPPRFFTVLGFAFISATLGSGAAFAQSGTQEQDSLRSYRLSEIVIGDTVDRTRNLEVIRRIPIAAIVREDAASAADLVRLIPSAHLQTNSRGESLIYVRNSGERQVGVFFDGALLNIPWDYRVDMSLIPAGMLGGVTVTRGVPSVVYGTNVIGGAVNLQSRSLSGTGSHTEIGGQYGSNSSRRVHATYLRKSAKWSAVASGSIFGTDGNSLPSDANLKFSQSGSSLRTNTDRQIQNVFVRLGRRFSEVSEIGVSVLHIDSEKGVAPEGHINPLTDRVRYWRYPMWQNTMVILNGAYEVGASGQLRAAFWLGRFGQRIEQYEDGSYDQLADLQKDRDHTVGVRLTGDVSVGPGTLLAAINWLTSTHRQTDLSYPSSGAQDVQPSQYRQVLFSTGAEYEVPVSHSTGALLGISVDGNATPETGDKPTRDPEFALGLTAGFRLELDSRSQLRWSAGRKVRFPTMRELFGEALQRFVLNPQLSPETSLQTELAYERSAETFSGEAILFFRRTYDTIDLEIIDLDGDRKRKRVNLDGSRVWGFELGGTARLTESLSGEGHVTWMDPDAFESGQTRRLNEKPELLASATLRLSLRWGGGLQVTVNRTGGSNALTLDNEQTRLPGYTELNVRASMREYFSNSGVYVELYLGVHNLTDEVSLPQLGLPGPGREFRVGTSVSF